MCSMDVFSDAVGGWPKYLQLRRLMQLQSGKNSRIWIAVQFRNYQHLLPIIYTSNYCLHNTVKFHLYAPGINEFLQIKFFLSLYFSVWVIWHPWLTLEDTIYGLDELEFYATTYKRIEKNQFGDNVNDSQGTLCMLYFGHTFHGCKFSVDRTEICLLKTFEDGSGTENFFLFINFIFKFF